MSQNTSKHICVFVILNFEKVRKIRTQIINYSPVLASSLRFD